MLRTSLLLMAALALVDTAYGAPGSTARPTPIAPKPPAVVPGAWRPAPSFKQVPIWPGDAPDGTFRPQAPESVQTFDDSKAAGGRSQAMLDIAVPTMTIMPAKGRATGTAI